MTVTKYKPKMKFILSPLIICYYFLLINLLFSVNLIGVENPRNDPGSHWHSKSSKNILEPPVTEY